MNEDEKRAHEIALVALPALLMGKKLDKVVSVSTYSTYLEAYNDCLNGIRDQQDL